ncbi:MAG TPA: ferredoxin reductase [Candidatus Limnocylindria bacterium]|nr:ferredoxin reductase [Candidatus Limnocylindria bacterium]
MARAALPRRLTWEVLPVVGHEQLTPKTWRVSVSPDGLEQHLAGQHVDVRLTAPDGYRAERSYSIASAPERGALDLVVERLEDGEVSPYLTDVLAVGDQLELRGPIGGYFVWHAELGGPLQLIAGGSGVAPFLAMLDHHRAAGSDAPARLLYSSRTLAEVIEREQLEQHRRRGVGVEITLTRERPEGWAGRVGRADAAMLQAVSFPPEVAPHVFVCGPTAFVEAVADSLVGIGHSPARIKTERFGGMEDRSRG